MKQLSIEKKKKIEGLVLVSPFILGVLLFFVYPLFTTIRLSFGELDRIEGFHIRWAGFKNYIEILTVDHNFVPMFLQVIKNVFTQVPLIIVFSLIMAILVNKDIRGRGFFRAAFFMPFLLGSGIVFEQIVAMGAINQFLTVESIGISQDTIASLGSQAVTLINTFFQVITTVLWNTGVQTLLFLSALQGISESLYESAKVDGANAWEVFWKITLPMVKPIMLVNIIYSLCNSFTDISNPIIKYTQQRAFVDLKYPESAAIGVLYLLFVLLLVGLVFLILGKKRTRGQ